MSQNEFLRWPLSSLPSWKAKWISLAGLAAEPNAYFRARHSWTLDEVSDFCRLHIAAESSYRLYLNGEFVGRGPVRGTKTLNFFDTYEVSSLLRVGRNWIAVEVHSPNTPTFKAAPAEPGVLMQLDNGELIATNETWQVQVAEEWRRDVRSYTFQIGFLEWQDLGREPVGWTEGKDLSLTWSSASVIGDGVSLAGKKLLARDIPGLEESGYRPFQVELTASVPPLEDANDGQIAKRMNEEAHSALLTPPDVSSLTRIDGLPVEIFPLGKGGVVLLLRFAEEINGAFEIEMEAPAGTIVDIAYDEDLCGERLPVLINAYAFADRYILREGRQTVGNAFTERGFRVVQIVIRNFSRSVKLFKVQGVDRIYPFIEKGAFACSDPSLSDIWGACVETLRACATDTFVDCPWRENTFYLNDLVVENVVALQAFGDPRLSARCFRLAASQARSDGLMPAAVPYGVMPGLTAEHSEDLLTLLAGNLFLPQMLEEYLCYSGDEGLVHEMIGTMNGVVDAFAPWADEDGLIQPPAKFWNFVDWSFEMNGHDLTTRNTSVLNWLYVVALDGAARILDKHGDPERAESLRQKVGSLALAIDRRFWSIERSCYVEWLEDGKPGPLASQLTQALAILSGRAPRHRKEALERALTRKDLLAPELYLHHFVLRALTATGQAAQALEVVRRYWWPVIEAGSPVIWECGVHEKGRAAFNGNGSGCHGFATTPIDFFQQVILGVSPTENGFAQCRVAPQCLGLAWAQGTVPTPHGLIHVSWKREDGEMLLKVDAPQRITVELPDGRVLFGGQAEMRLSDPPSAR